MALEAEGKISRGKSVDAVQVDATTTFGIIVDLHIRDLAEVGKPLLRSKAYSLDKLKSDLGKDKLAGLTRERIIAYAKQRAQNGAGAATIGMDIGYIQTILVHAAAVHGIDVPVEQIKLARVALRRLNLVDKGNFHDLRHEATSRLFEAGFDITGPKYMKAGPGIRTRVLYKLDDLMSWVERKYSSTSEYKY